VLALVAAASAAEEDACERALAKASAKFVDASLKSAQRCLMNVRRRGLPAGACRLVAASTGDRRTDAALAHARAQLRRGTARCPDPVLSAMGFETACADPSPADGFVRADVDSCIAHTHMQAVQALVSIQFPQQTDDCGNGVVDDVEDCDPAATPSGCDVGEVCVPAGTLDACSCIEEGDTDTCGDGMRGSSEQCDPAAQPTGCATGLDCVAAGQANQCTCTDGSGNQCEGTCTPACTPPQTCSCSCASGGVCGNGVRDEGEQCDPMANPSGCGTGLICGAPGTVGQCACSAAQPGEACGNGAIDPGEACDPALPNTCDPGEVCLSSGALACTCGAPPSNCGNGLIEWGEQCDPSANPTGCTAGQTCTPDECTCVTGGGVDCGNGTVDPGEQCDPTAVPTGCAVGQTCGGQCTCSGGGANCGNGTIDTGEQCDPTANPTGCPGGSTCSVSCTCGPGGPTTTLPSGGECCSAAQIVTTSSPGTLQVSTLPAFPFPAGVQTIMNLGPADANCRHAAIVPAGGFTVPVFCIPSLHYTSVVVARGCAAGGSDGNGTVWDAAATAPDPNVSRVGDTSDGTCNPAGQTCSSGAGGAGNNTQGNIDTTRGGSPTSGGGVHTQIDIPVTSITWSDADGACPDADGQFDPGRDLIITNFDFILSPTTGGSSARFSDLNSDGCSFAGSGPESQSNSGSAAPGPCCTVGQSTTVVATGVAFTGGAPLFDLSFNNTTPTTISACNAAPTSLGSCTLTNDACQD
jgi:hypothetical protein